MYVMFNSLGACGFGGPQVPINPYVSPILKTAAALSDTAAALSDIEYKKP